MIIMIIIIIIIILPLTCRSSVWGFRTLILYAFFNFYAKYPTYLILLRFHVQRSVICFLKLRPLSDRGQNRIFALAKCPFIAPPS